VGALKAVREAIVTSFDESNAFAPIVANGGLYFGRVPEGTALPYARYADIPLNTPILPFGATVIYPLVFQFDFWAVSRADAVGYVEALIVLLNKQSLSLSDGSCRMVVLQNNPAISIEPGKTKDGRDVYRGRVAFTFWANT